MTLSLRVDLRRGPLHLAVSLHGLTGITALVGPNGAGKTTLLRALAGLEPPGTAADRVELDGQQLGSQPPHLRRIGLVLADALLRPTATTLDEVAVAAAGRRSARRAAAAAVLGALQAGELAPRKCGTLSSGEAARITLARALAARPHALLLDEPLARLDAEARPALRSALREALAAYPHPVLLVTHDAVDVAALASRVIVLEAGSVVQDCTPTELTRRPRSPWAARFSGIELLRGVAAGTVVTLDAGGTISVAESHNGPVLVALRASGVALSNTPPQTSARNVWPVTVKAVEPLGSSVRVALNGAPSVSADVTPAAVTELHIEVGTRLWASVKATDLDAYPV